MPLVGKKHRRGPKALLLLVVAAAVGAAALSGKDIQRYLKIRSM